MLKQQALYCLVKRETKSFALIKICIEIYAHSFIRGAFSTIEVCWWLHTSATRAKRTEYIGELCHFPETAHSANTGFFWYFFIYHASTYLFIFSLTPTSVYLCWFFCSLFHSFSNLLHADYIFFNVRVLLLYIFSSSYSHFCARWNN